MKDTLSSKQVLHIAKLARLKLSDKEVGRLQKELASILDYMGMLNNLKLKGVKPTFQTTGLQNIFRKDQVESCLSQAESMEEAKSKNKGYFLTKAIFANKNDN